MLGRPSRAGRRGRRCRGRRRRRRRPACRPCTALAALVPCADDGMRQTVALRVAATAVVGADGEQPGELALAAGVRLQRHGVVAGDRRPASPPAGRCSVEVALRPGRPGRTGGCAANSGQVTGSISVAALSFIVHEPSGIMAAVERDVLVGEACEVRASSPSRSGAVWNTGCVRILASARVERGGHREVGAEGVGDAAGAERPTPRRPASGVGGRRWSRRG